MGVPSEQDKTINAREPLRYGVKKDGTVSVRGDIKLSRTRSNPLGEYLTRGTITQRMHDDGVQLAEDWRAAGMSGYKAPVLEKEGKFAPPRWLALNAQEGRLMAMDRYLMAMEEVGDERSRALLWHVCCVGHYMAELEVRYVMGGKTRTYKDGKKAIKYLRKALENLGKHYADAV